MSFPSDTEFKEILLERLQFYNQTVLDEKVFMELDFRTHRMIEADSMLLSMIAYVLGKKFEPIVIQYPTTWVDAILDRFLPLRLRDKIRINYTKFTVDRMLTFPEYHVPEMLGKYYRLISWQKEEYRTGPDNE